MTDRPERPARLPRADTREVAELKQLKIAQPELATAVDMQLELLEVQRRVQGRVPLPWIQPDPAWLEKTNHHHQPPRPARQGLIIMADTQPNVAKGDTVKVVTAWGEHVDATVRAVRGNLLDVAFQYEGSDVVITSTPFDAAAEKPDTWHF